VKIKIVLNPYASRWGARDRLPAVESAFLESGMDYDLTVTSRPGQGKIEAFRAAVDGYDAIIAAGGDGTVNEVVNGLIEAAGNDDPIRPLGVLPLGTGNDFNDMNALPRTLTESVAVIAAGHTRQIDAGQVTADGIVHYFDNNCALAMEPVVTIENVKLTRLSGTIRYIVATLIALTKLRAWQMRVTWDDGSYEGPIFLLSVCNSPRTGGLFLMAPSALVDDGLFDFVIAPKMPKPEVLTIVLRLLNGSHYSHRRITHDRTSQLTVESNPGTPIHADGEVIATAAKQIRFDILPGKITLLSPK
jgi:diacylglycerol kinase (ATP)